MSSTDNILLTVMYIITMLVSLVGNILLLYIVWKKPDVRSLTSFMFVNMAVADLLVTLVVIPYTISDFYTHGVWSMTGLIGQITCKTVIFIAFFTITTSILCLAFMAVDRFYAVVYPFRRLLWFRKPKVLTPVVWLLSMALMSIVPVFVVLQWYPVSIISVLYTITARKLWIHEAPGDGLNQNRQLQQQTKRKVVRMLIIVFTAFALCWLPGQVFQLYLAITEWSKDLPIVTAVCYWFGYNNSAVNPWLYICLNSKINHAFSTLIGRKLRMVNRSWKTEVTDMTLPEIKETK